MRGQAAGFHEGVDRQAVQNAEASEVHRDASDISAAPIDSADAGEAVIADELVEDVPAHHEIFVDLDVDQSAVDDEVSVRTTDKFRSRAEGRVQHARSFRSKFLGPHERQHVADIFDYRFVDRLQVQQADPIDQIELREVHSKADQLAARFCIALALEVRAYTILRRLNDAEHALLRARSLMAASNHQSGALFREPAPRLGGRIELLEIEPHRIPQPPKRGPGVVPPKPEGRREVEKPVLKKAQEPPVAPRGTIAAHTEPITAELVSSAMKDQASQALYELRLPLGKNTDNGKFIFWDPVTNTPKKLTNQHVLIVGKSGAGKTQTASAFLWELSKTGVPSIIFDFQGEYMSGKLVNADGASFLDCTKAKVLDAADGINVNPLEVPLDPHTGKKQNYVKVVYQVAHSLAKIFGLGDIQHAILRDAINQAFIAAGFAPNNKETWQ